MTRSPSHAHDALAQGYLELYPAEAARALDALPSREALRLLERTPTSSAVRVLEALTPDVAALVLEAMREATARRLLTASEPPRAAVLLSRLGREEREARLALLPLARAAEVRDLLTYPPDSAGRLMDPRVTTFHQGATVKEVRARLRVHRHRGLHEVFLIDEGGRLTGAVPLQDIALALPGEVLSGLSRGTPASIQAMATREEVVDRLAQRGTMGLAVVDLEGRLLGVIRHEALVAAVREEASADIQTMVGASKEERALSPVPFAVRKRLPWLEVNLATAFLAASVVGLFEGTIARFTALAVLLPVVAGQSGNTGAQALAVTMRGLALREIRLSQWLRVSVKEVNVALINGVAVALTTSLGVYLWSSSLGLALVIGLSMVISMIAAGLSGAAIPMLLAALGQDPAQSSSIVLTTVTDVVGFFSFLGIATLLAGML